MMAQVNTDPRRLVSSTKLKIGDHVSVSRDKVNFVLATILAIGIDPVGNGQMSYSVRLNQSFAEWGELGKAGERFTIPLGLEGVLIRRA